MELDAVVLFDAQSRIRIAGLTAGERAVRVARRAGAGRVHVIDRSDPEARARSGTALIGWRVGRTCPVLVIRADQLVHPPLVAPLVAAPPVDGVAIAVGDDGQYAGALLAAGAGALAAIDALARGEPDTRIAAGATARIPHGPIARHPIATAEDRRGAHRMLYRILIKPQDNAITRYLYRPVSFPLTRLLVWTPITPNQVSYAVAALVAIGCWLVARASFGAVIAGTAITVVASYLDCCDGEIARLKLTSSRLGAWIDTVVDELSTMGYMAAIGWHCHLAYGAAYFGRLGARCEAALGHDPWQVAIAVGLATYAWAMFCIYYNIIVGVGSANSQDYAGRFEVVAGSAANAVRLRPVVQAIAPRGDLPRWLQLVATYAPYAVRRDFITWFTMAAVLVRWTDGVFFLFFLGGAVTFVIVSLDHVRLRRLLRAIARRGETLERGS
ncbi:MAG TPA: CDP-alcohol phosphatidyltransferase family protein [Kofleriaceae bacterium]|nr:CDP-alcohol phosphatidyltransferase family protein [Kofleriaceae bacterium]